MFNRREKAAARIDTLIGRTTRVHGDIEFEGGLHIDGRVAGNVHMVAGGTAALSVSEHGIVEGSVTAAQVVLNGAVYGDIAASERVVLGAKARVRGNVSYGIIEMALGAEINGRLIPGGVSSDPALEPAAAGEAGAAAPEQAVLPVRDAGSHDF